MHDTSRRSGFIIDLEGGKRAVPLRTGGGGGAVTISPNTRGHDEPVCWTACGAKFESGIVRVKY